MRKRYVILIVLAVFYGIIQFSLTMRTRDSDAIRAFREKGVDLATRTLHIRDRHLHYVSVGPDSMSTLVFIHGSPGSWDAFQQYLLDTALRRRYRMISIDRPGYGYSDYGDAMPLTEDCGLICSFLDSVKNDKPVYLVGHSLGGSIVPVLAADRPDMISGIVVLAGALDPALENKESWRYAMTLVPLRYLMPGAMRQSNDELWYFKNDVLHLKSKLACIKCPVYIVHAVNDALVGVENVAYMKHEMTSASVTDTIFPEGNHFIPWNHFDYIRNLLAGLSRAHNVTF